MRVAVDGGPPIKMVQDTGLFLGGAASSDGMLIYSPGNALYRIAASGEGGAERLTPEPEPGDLYVGPVLLPGERALLFNQTNDRVAILDLTTREQRVLVDDGRNPAYLDSGHIVFARGTTLMAVPFDIERLVTTGDPVALFQGVRRPGPNTAADFAVAANGTLAYIPPTAAESDTSRIVWVDRNGEVLEAAIRERLSNPRDPRLSPDGTRLLVTTGNFGTGQMWVHDTRGRPPVVLANRGDNTYGAWSPDGRQVAFFSNRGGAYDLVALPADGGTNPMPLLPEAVGAAPAVWWDRDELILVRPNLDLLAARVGSGQVREVLATSDDEFDAALSSDGRWLAYASTRTGEPESGSNVIPTAAPFAFPAAAVASRSGRATGESSSICKDAP